jgi:hypothetical protein
VNRGRELKLICASLTACASSSALGRDPAPSLSIDPIVARGLLAPVDDARTASGYRLDPGLEPSDGQRARLSIGLGKATMFAITGRLKREAAPTGPLDPGNARAMGQRRDSGKVYGAGVSAVVRGVDLSATYQYSKISAEQGDADTFADTPGRSHSLRATARFRFRR